MTKVIAPRPPHLDLPRRGFPALDGLRGIAAILVVGFHVRSSVFGYADYPAGDGYLAVDLFFFLSGIVLDYAYRARLQAALSFRKFFILRVVRLYPLYFMGLLFGFLSSVYFGSRLNHLVPSLLTEVFFLPSPFGGALFSVNNPAWSLFFEIIVNLVFAATIRVLTVKRLMIILGVSFLFVIAVAVKHQDLSVGNTWKTAPYAIPRTAFSFFFGVLSHRILGRKAAKVQLPAMMAIPAVLILIMCLIVPIPSRLRAVYDVMVVAAIFPTIATSCMFISIPKRGLSLLSFLGVTSYAIYAVHYPLIPMFLNSRFVEAVGGVDTSYTVATVSIVAVLLAFAYLLDRWVDIPLRRRLTAAFKLGRPPG